MVDDPRGNLVEAAIQLLFILLDYTPPADLARSVHQHQQRAAAAVAGSEGGVVEGVVTDVTHNGRTLGDSGSLAEPGMKNLFCSFVSRLHQSEVGGVGGWREKCCLTSSWSMG